MSKALLYNVSILIEETKELSDRLKALESKQLNTERWLDSMSTTVEAIEQQILSWVCLSPFIKDEKEVDDV